ncbi:LysM peptidoglycan-binding domain-containing protein [Pontibacter chitinilyticus]|uniref:LysM peptidoglycan-binding domain-containing protein n=1 Tax=Pontibacter chitinilyticus TaxID=2674989 RepID=UPI00321B7F73
MKLPVTRILTSVFFFFVFVMSGATAAPGNQPFQLSRPLVTAGDSTYLVQEGDTYYGLAHRFQVPLDSLQRWNGMQLQIGQTIFLTHAAPTTGAAAPHQPAAAKPAVQTVSAAKYGEAATAPARAPESTSAAAVPLPGLAEHKTKKRILVIPFDPYLYFSDADYEIARQSKIPRQNVRYVFRNRLNALLAPSGYETIHLLGGVYRDSVNELSKVYKSLSYTYQDNKQSKYNHQPAVKEPQPGALEWIKRQKEKLGIDNKAPEQVPVAQDPNKHFGVTVKDPEFFTYFNNQYGIDYYVFINQFEVKTVYEHCLDRAAMNYERNFLVHYSIYDSNGELVSGNKVSVPYHSNMNDIQRIVSDNMPGVARRVLSDLPAAKE